MRDVEALRLQEVSDAIVDAEACEGVLRAVAVEDEMVDVRRVGRGSGPGRERRHLGHRPAGIVGLPGGAIAPFVGRGLPDGHREQREGDAGEHRVEKAVPAPPAAQGGGEADHHRQRERQRPDHRIVAA